MLGFSRSVRLISLSTLALRPQFGEPRAVAGFADITKGLPPSSSFASTFRTGMAASPFS
jgi:hypothetical protein